MRGQVGGVWVAMFKVFVTVPLIGFPVGAAELC